jgi:hypothetical protein
MPGSTAPARRGPRPLRRGAANARAAALFLASLLVAACSGGGGGSDPGPTCTGTHLCNAGAKQCTSATEVQTCTTGPDGCRVWSAAAACASGLTCDFALDACAGTVTLSWPANRESRVNAPGGGYQIIIAGRAPIDVPYVSGPSAPTSANVLLPAGSYVVTVKAFGVFDLDATGSTSRTYSAASPSKAFSVP